MIPLAHASDLELTVLAYTYLIWLSTHSDLNLELHVQLQHFPLYYLYFICLTNCLCWCYSHTSGGISTSYLHAPMCHCLCHAWNMVVVCGLNWSSYIAWEDPKWFYFPENLILQLHVYIHARWHYFMTLYLISAAGFKCMSQYTVSTCKFQRGTPATQ